MFVDKNYLLLADCPHQQLPKKISLGPNEASCSHPPPPYFLLSSPTYVVRRPSAAWLLDTTYAVVVVVTISL